MDPLRDYPPRERLRLCGIPSVVRGEDRDLAAVPQTATRVQLPDCEAHAAQLINAVGSLLSTLWALDRDQKRQG